MAVVSMKQLLESGVHFGHATRRWNPKMAPYIYTSRKDIHIIDLKRTKIEIENAYEALFEIVKDGGKVLFVGTKKQAQESIREEAIRAGQFYVDHRWLGGTLTNFKTIRKRIQLLHDLYRQEKDGVWDKLPKKEVIQLVRKRDRLEKFLGGIKEMRQLPQAIFVVDPNKELIAINEARKAGIPIFAIVDTNCDPDLIDHVIPANDDAIRAIKLITWVMGNACVEAQGGEVEKFDDEEDVQQDQRQQRPRRKTRRDQQDGNRPAQPASPAKAPAQPATPVKEEVQPQPKVEVVEEKKAPAKAAPKAEKAVDVDYEGMTVAELKALAKDRDLSGYSALRKAELIELLKNN